MSTEKEWGECFGGLRREKKVREKVEESRKVHGLGTWNRVAEQHWAILTLVTVNVKGMPFQSPVFFSCHVYWYNVVCSGDW